MALTNAEKQARWRARHTQQRKNVARITNLLLRRAHSDREVRREYPKLKVRRAERDRYEHEIEAKIGWNTVTFDSYFYRLALLIAEALKTDQAIRQLRWALAVVLEKRKHARWARKGEITTASGARARNITVADPNP